MSEQETPGTPPENVYAEEGAATAAATIAESKPLFTDDEIKQFDADDVEVGGAIGKMLAVFFLYTVCAMSHVAYWTVYGSVNGLFVSFTVVAMCVVAWLSFRAVD